METAQAIESENQALVPLLAKILLELVAWEESSVSQAQTC